MPHDAIHFFPIFLHSAEGYAYLKNKNKNYNTEFE